MKVTRLISEGGARQICQKFGSVLADTPSLVLDLPKLLHLTQMASGHVSRDIFRAIKEGMMLPYRLRRGPSCNFLATLVPHRDRTGRIKGINGVVRRTIHNPRDCVGGEPLGCRTFIIGHAPHSPHVPVSRPIVSITKVIPDAATGVRRTAF